MQNLNSTPNDLTLDFTLNPAGQIATNARDNNAFSFTGHANANVADTINGLNQVTATGGTSVSHGDSRGNITAIGGSSYGYSSENMMVTAPNSATLSHDPMLRLYQAVGGGTTTRFAYDGGQMIAEYNGSNALQRRYVFGPGMDEPLVWYEGTGTSTPRYFHADERGSIIAVSDASGDLVSTRNRYDEYGNVQGTLTGRFGYTGQAWIPEANLAYYRARMYNPTLGRFMQTDPIGYGSGMNIYAYVLNNPVNLVDPSGLEQLCYDQITRGWVDTVDKDVTIMATRVREVCINTGPLQYYGDFASGGGGGVPRPGDCAPNDAVCQARARISLEGVLTDLGRAIREPVENCVRGVPEISLWNMGRPMAMGAARGAVGGAIGGALFGSFMGPAGTLMGGAGGAVGGTLRGAVQGAIGSAISQACSARN